jgi:Formamidopyrimidine-DNA glycosylase
LVRLKSYINEREIHMIEFPEAVVLSSQILDLLGGKKITRVIPAGSPHKFAFFLGDPENYRELLTGKSITGAKACGALVEISMEDVNLLLGDGVNLRLFKKSEKLPEKHQLLIEFEDGSVLICSVQMYGGIWAFKKGEFDNKYYQVAQEKPSALADEFDFDYFNNMFRESSGKMSLKAFLATEQRIPGLGNGTLQDILFNAGFHPKKKLNSLSEEDVKVLFSSVKSTLGKMVSDGARDTESDMQGKPGGYRTILSKNTVGKPCSACNDTIKKEAYLGGSIYYCSTCQKL